MGRERKKWAGSYTLLLGLITACGGATPAEAPTANPAPTERPTEPVGIGAPKSSDPKADAEPGETAPNTDEATDPGRAGLDAPGDSAQSVAHAAPEEPTERAKEVCEETCSRVEASCSARAAQFCRASCRDYESAARKCPVEVEEALACQLEAEDFLLCSNIAAASCAPLYRDLLQCRSGAQEPRSRTIASEETHEVIPNGFERVVFPGGAFSSFFPALTDSLATSTSPAQPSSEPAPSKPTPPPNLSAALDGHTYELKMLPTTGRLTDSAILRAALAEVGPECSPSLRLHGRYETDGVTHIRFTTSCKDAVTWEGMLHFWPPSAAMQSVRGPDVKSRTDIEAFLFSFQKSPSTTPSTEPQGAAPPQASSASSSQASAPAQ